MFFFSKCWIMKPNITFNDIVMCVMPWFFHQLRPGLVAKCTIIANIIGIECMRYDKSSTIETSDAFLDLL